MGADSELTPTSPEMIWQMYEGLTSQCQHFNGLESTYRALASTWLLAAFGGVGYVLSNNVGGHAALLSAAIGAAAALGIVLLWILDLQVYHSLLVGAFSEQLRLEREHPWLPQSAHQMQKAHRGEGVLPKVVWFYVASYLLMVAMAAFALGAAVDTRPMAARISLAVVVLVVAGVPVALRMRRTALGPHADVLAYAASVHRSDV
jgi:hypothetical protein